MKYSLNDYLPYLSDPCTRLEVCPGKELAAKLISEYKVLGAQVISLYQLLEPETKYIPNPSDVIHLVQECAGAAETIVAFIGIEAYLTFLRREERKDFFIGLRGLLDKQRINARFLINRTYVDDKVYIHPKYEDAMFVVRFCGSEVVDEDLTIALIPSRWAGESISAEMTVGALEKMGDYAPTGSYYFAMNEADLPDESYNNVTVVSSAVDALRVLYQIEADFDLEQVDTLLVECKAKNLTPANVLKERFGGEDYLTCEKAPVKLLELKDDILWDLYIWLLKSRIAQNTYLYRVLHGNPTADNFLAEYIVYAAKRMLGNENAVQLAKERASAVTKMKSVEPLIAKFVSETGEDFRSIPFLNCHTDSEIQGLIRWAAKSDLSAELPKEFDQVSPVISCYLAPYFNYGDEQLTAYFTKLRRFRIKDDVDEAFVKEAYCAAVPKEIEARDKFIRKFDNGETALLVVDGLGAEYYPFLLNMAKRNHLKIAESRIVSVNLPTSTEFNKVVWNEANVLQEIKRADNISHDGYSKHEICAYEENLAEVMLLFEKKILTRVVSGLKNYKRVVVTADHGSSYLAVTAYRKGLTHTIPWENPDDWRYTSLPESKNVSEDLEPVYRPDKEPAYYYVAKGYNRLPKQGSKLYGLHGGATLEERLVPCVVFTNQSVQEVLVEEVEQFSEKEDFDIL